MRAVLHSALVESTRRSLSFRRKRRSWLGCVHQHLLVNFLHCFETVDIVSSSSVFSLFLVLDAVQLSLVLETCHVHGTVGPPQSSQSFFVLPIPWRYEVLATLLRTAWRRQYFVEASFSLIAPFSRVKAVWPCIVRVWTSQSWFRLLRTSRSDISLTLSYSFFQSRTSEGISVPCWADCFVISDFARAQARY